MHLSDLIDWVPFVLGVKGEGVTLNVPRIVEALVIASISGGVAMWGTQQVLKSDIQYLSAQVQELSMEVKTMRRDLYRPIGGGVSNATR